jgi:hypothetical protein
MPPALRAKVEIHRKKWGYLGYHGYGTRTLPDVDRYMHRVTSALSDARESLWTTEEYTRALAEAEGRRVVEFRRLRIDETHQVLFRLHSRIGIAKLFRRYVQLRNFAHLDQMLSDISRRKECPEEVIRCLLPEEVEERLQSGAGVNDDLARRTEFAAHVIQDGAEGILGGKEFAWVRDRLSERIHTRKMRCKREAGLGTLCHSESRLLIGVNCCFETQLCQERRLLTGA